MPVAIYEASKYTYPSIYTIVIKSLIWTNNTSTLHNHNIERIWSLYYLIDNLTDIFQDNQN